MDNQDNTRTTTTQRQHKNKFLQNEKLEMFGFYMWKINYDIRSIF